MRVFIIKALVFCAFYANAQCVDINDVFYLQDSIKQLAKYEGKEEYWEQSKKFWEIQKKAWQSIVNKSPNVSINHYYLAIAMFKTDEYRDKVKKVIDKAIDLNPKRARYYAVRGIVIYCMGIDSRPKMEKACPDLKKAVQLGLSKQYREPTSSFSWLLENYCN